VHLKHVMSKLGATDRTEATTLALQRGIIHLDD
jgi:DNA-binding NarL/FixJ family response regulator